MTLNRILVATVAGLLVGWALSADGRKVAMASAEGQAGLRVGAAAVDLEADDSMPIAGSIHAGRAQGQEGKLRATAVVIQHPASAPVAIVSCDVLMITRDLADPAAAEIEKTCAIPTANVLIHATHTHHAPSTVRVHGYDRCQPFCEQLQRAIVQAVAQAKSKLADSSFWFRLGQENTVGMNSRLLLEDGTIYWVGPRNDVVRPTGPFDPDLPVLAFRDPSGKLQALVFGHSTHSIGTLRGGVRSPCFYGLAAQSLEEELGAPVAFLEGASGSTHAFNVTAADAMHRIRQAVLATLAEAQPHNVTRVAALKAPFVFRVRHFDEAAEDKAVADYCTKRIGPRADGVIAVFSQMRQQLAPQQGQQRTTWLQVLAIGDVAIVGVPAELFTQLGIDIKRQSPLKHTVIAELANDWIGYVPDREGHQLGGYQVWTGLHSYVEPGTGERMVEQALALLRQLAEAKDSPSR